MIIKVCGLRDSENIKAIDQLQPNWIGMIFYEKSARFIDTENIPETNALKVGVFVNQAVDSIIKTAESYGLSYIQLHGDETADTAALLYNKGYKVIKAFSVGDTINTALLKAFTPYCAYFLFDTKGKNYGGNGVKFNWNVLQSYDLSTPFILSGGIQPQDVEAIKNINHPAYAGVDINSGFELSKGMKNVDAVKQFIDGIRTR